MLLITMDAQMKGNIYVWWLCKLNIYHQYTSLPCTYFLLENIPCYAVREAFFNTVFVFKKRFSIFFIAKNYFQIPTIHEHLLK